MSRFLLILLALTLLISFSSCASPELPKPPTEFTSIYDYVEWADQVGYSQGGLIPSGPEGVNRDIFRTAPGAPGYESGRIVIGDSRCCQLGVYQLRAGFSEYAVFAVWGGHYAEWEPYIPTDDFYEKVEECFAAQIRARGKCDIFFYATVNDYDPEPGENGSNISAAVACAEKLASMKCVHNGKTYSPRVTVIGIEGGEETDSGWIPQGFNRGIEAYNAELRAALEASPILAETASRYTTVPLLTGGRSDFIDDCLHYGDETLRTLVLYMVG